MSETNFWRKQATWLATKSKTAGQAIQKRWATWAADKSTLGIIARFSLLFIVLGFVGILSFCGAVYFGAFGKLPTESELKDIQHSNASEVYSEDGVLLGKYYIENRINAKLEEISPQLLNALIATEDARFFEHRGIDFRAAFRVLFKSVLMQDESAGGGSTLSQQLAKNLYKRQSYRFLTMPINKVKEMFIATRLEDVYTKEELLSFYLNTVTFSENIFGIKVAADRFFKTSPKDIKIEEAAVLVGMLKGTYSYNPLKNPERSLQRRNTVLSRMAKYEYLTPAISDSLQQLPIDLKYYQEGHNEGLATYFREHLRHEVDDFLKDKTKADGSVYNLYTDGLKIHTTLNSKMQNYAEEAVAERMSSLQDDFDKHWKGKKPWGDDKILEAAVRHSKRYKELKARGYSEEKIKANFDKKTKMTVFAWDEKKMEQEMSPLDSVKYYLSLLHTGFMAMEPQSGRIKAWVGGINHEYFQYDHIKSRRQVGSTFKPIVYAKALQSGVQPCEYIDNHLVTYTEYEDWKPENSNGQYGGVYSLAGALTKSVNSVSVNLILRSGIKEVKELAEQMGITSEIPEVPAIALGAVDISLYDMVKVYGTFANRGKRPEPFFITKIETATGEVLGEFEPKPYQELEQVLTEEHADIMIKLLESVVDSGTARRLRYEYHFNNEMCGKTGTTQNQSDGWFMGFTPNLVAGAWVGADIPAVHFRTLKLGQGGNTALPIWGKFMQKVYKDKEFKKWQRYAFQPIPDTLYAYLDCPNYLEERPWWEEEENYQDMDGEGLFDNMIGIFRRNKQDPGSSTIDRRGSQRQSTIDRRSPQAQRRNEHSERIRQQNEKMKERREKKAKRKRFWNKVFKNGN